MECLTCRHSYSVGILTSEGRVMQAQFSEFENGDFVDVSFSLNIHKRQDGSIRVVFTPERIIKIASGQKV